MFVQITSWDLCKFGLDLCLMTSRCKVPLLKTDSMRQFELDVNVLKIELLPGRKNFERKDQRLSLGLMPRDGDDPGNDCLYILRLCPARCIVHKTSVKYELYDCSFSEFGRLCSRALALCAAKRFVLQGVTSPSQLRYLSYMEAIIQCHVDYVQTYSLIITKVSMSKLPMWVGTWISLRFWLFS